MAEIPTLRTQINGEVAEWTPAIWQKWYTHIDQADPKLYDTHGLPTLANYYTPRPYVDQYNRGSKTEGFTFVVGRKVYARCINGYVDMQYVPQEAPRG